MLVRPKTIRRANDEPEVIEAMLTHAELLAVNSFWEYRVYMNPRLTSRDRWPNPRRFHGSITLDPTRVGPRRRSPADETFAHLKAKTPAPSVKQKAFC
jgi:hypothetical protein